MRLISDIEVLPDFNLAILFEGGVKKIFDMKPYLNLPVFQVLKNETNFNNIKNQGYFIEWANHEVDLSSDTLWIEGETLLDRL